MSARPVRPIQIDGQPIRVFEAWRAPSGLGLAYFAVESDAAADRRSVVEADTDLAAMSHAVVEGLWADGAPLTATERRITDRERREWLAQGLGPVWAEGGTAADAVGTRLRCLSEEQPALDLTGVTPDGVTDEALLEAIERHLTPPES